jgi:hypothetical protein
MTAHQPSTIRHPITAFTLVELLLVITIIGFLIAILPIAQAAAATKVFLLAGQSNMAGYGVVADLSLPYREPHSTVKIWDCGSSQWVALRGGFGATAAYFGPELSFGHRIQSTFPTDNIYLVKVAADSTSLAVNWRPDGTGVAYNAFKSTVNAALANLRDGGAAPVVSGMLWMQGERDAQTPGYAAAYAANLSSFIDEVRHDFSALEMSFVAGRIRTDWGAAADNDLVRTAQMIVPHAVGHGSWADTDNLVFNPQVGLHYGTQGQIDLGILYADKFVQTPEPSTWGLTGTALLAMAGYWRRRAPGSAAIETRD